MTAATFTGILGKRALISYVDPHPGLKGTDRVMVECGRCVNGVYQAPSGLTWRRNGVETAWCFYCNGSNRRSVQVGTVRRVARMEAYQVDFADEIAAAEQAERDARIAADLADNFARDWDAAHAESAKRSAMVQGFIGLVGDKVTGLVGTVDVAKYIAAERYDRSSSMFVIITLVTGQVVKMFGSSASLFSLERGDDVTIVSAKVKGVDNFKGQDQTVLSHVKVDVIEREEVNA